MDKMEKAIKKIHATKKPVKLSKQARAAVEADRAACKAGKGKSIPAKKAFKSLNAQLKKMGLL